MPSLLSLQEHYELKKGHSGGGIHAYLCESRRGNGLHRIAYCTDKMKRWKLGGPIGRSAAEVMIDKLHRDVQRGNGYIYFIHDVRTQQRENILIRFQKHRQRQAERREMMEVESLPNFGLF